LSKSEQFRRQASDKRDNPTGFACDQRSQIDTDVHNVPSWRAVVIG